MDSIRNESEPYIEPINWDAADVVAQERFDRSPKHVIRSAVALVRLRCELGRDCGLEPGFREAENLGIVACTRCITGPVDAIKLAETALQESRRLT